MKFYSLIFLFILSICAILLPRDFDHRDIPIHENGRIKPLDTFVKNQLLLIYGKRSIKQNALPGELNSEGLSALDWFFDIALHPDEGDKYRIFNISNPEVVASLGLDWDPEHLYNQTEVLTGLKNQIHYITTIQRKPEAELTQFDTQMLKVYSNAIQYQTLSYSLSCLLPSIQIHNETIAQSLSVNPGDKLSYYQLMRKANKLSPLMERLINRDKNKWSESDYELQHVMGVLNEIDQDKFARILKIIPSESGKQNEEWQSPWELMESRMIGPNQEKLLLTLESFLKFRIDNDSIKSDSLLAEYEKLLSLQFKGLINLDNVKLETWKNKANLFYKSIAFYILAFLLLVISWMTTPRLLRRISFACLLGGLTFHFYGILLRIIIMQRPPVSTLYESIIFVGLIGVICASLLEYNRKDGMGIFIGAIVGGVLHFVGLGYANDGDTLGMLVAVLNSNFWLATHVTTITIGYGASLFAGLLGHIYLLQLIRIPFDKKYLNTVNANLFGATLFALFFTLFGTILGGIWADQSWGRFWGWDPKENGALLIVMWQIMMLHLRITGLVKPMGFALGMVLNNIVVILAWFGVNLLNVGLHSYGFAAGIAINISLFTIFELITGFGSYFWAKNRQKQLTAY
ncbi:MAG: cytochrome c biogenesis protein CcsA [Candidatus Marinimicrobia bacterium]|jgi:ABC-type transport system involved in cytochrome c biogenesis permease subunit|nr:cytochrome c biogenesis protein CcsA [Candidatus Neomarinimicrobiota bacterium]